jgi:glycosyltransferase involved in cell wall biosynthesis
MMGGLLVSVCIPTYNRAASLRRSVALVQAQDYDNLDILISDNASDDETPAVARELALRDPRIRYVRHPKNIGLYGNHNFCIEEGRGEFLCIFHDHDEHESEVISQYVAFLRQHPEVAVVCSDWDLIDEDGAVIGARVYDVPDVTPGLEYISQTIRSGRSSIGIPGAMVRRSALGDIRFDEDGPIGFGDFVVWFRVAERHGIGHLRRRLWRWRQQRASQSARTIESWIHDYHENMSRYCDEHQQRWPEHAALVRRWRQDIDRYIFWALAFELALDCRRQLGLYPRRNALTLFDINDYDLTPSQVAGARRELQRRRHGVGEWAAWLAIELSIRLRFPWPLAWSTYHHAFLRKLIRLR